MSTAIQPVRFAWWKESTPEAHRALIAASFGWMLDSFDVMLYALVLSSLLLDLGMSKQQAGTLGSLTLLAAAAGGIAFGFIADRFGRTRALIGSVLLYAVFTAACGFAHNILQLAIFRILLGIGMGGEWASGAALVSETWPDKHRGKALGIMQSAWAIGYGLAALTAGIVLPWKGWRAVFFVGVLPALLTLFIRKGVKEPELWLTRNSSSSTGGFRSIFRKGRRATTIIVTFMNACCLFAWWGYNLWVPAYLSLPSAKGGVGMSERFMSFTVAEMQCGMWLGYVSFGYISDTLGRKRTYVAYLVSAAVLMFVYGRVHTPWMLLILGPIMAFVATGYFSGFAAVTSELYETSVRGTAMGFTYNVGRIASAAAPFVVGSLAQTRGFAPAFCIAGAAFVAAAISWIWIPETGRTLR